jgi:GNAT superfamily N-acetyltransferase
MELEIRQARSEDDFDQVRGLYRSFLDWMTQTCHDVLFLLEDYFASVKAESEALPGTFGPPNGSLLLAWIDGTAVGTVALQDFGDGSCEMKRMFVSTSAQGNGVGRALVEQILEEARKHGYDRMVLETGPRQLAAKRLYARSGFQEIQPYYDFDLGVPEEIIASLPEDIQLGVTFMEFKF